MQDNYCWTISVIYQRRENSYVPFTKSSENKNDCIWCYSMPPPLLQLTFQIGSFKKILFILPLIQQAFPYCKAPSTSVVLYSLCITSMFWYLVRKAQDNPSSAVETTVKLEAGLLHVKDFPASESRTQNCSGNQIAICPCYSAQHDLCSLSLSGEKQKGS